MPNPPQSGSEAERPLIQTATEAREHAIRVAIEANLQTSRLLFLPFEIRSRILKFALPSTYDDEDRENIWQFGGASVLRTCKQLHEEGASIMYANPFNFKLDTVTSDTIYIRYVNSRYMSLQGCRCCRKRGRDCRKITNVGCRDHQRGWSIQEKTLSLADMGSANVALMRHWIIEFHGWGKYSEDYPHRYMRYLGIRSEVEFIWWYAKCVEQALRGPLKQIKGVKKVAVKWTGKCPGSKIVKQRYRAWILLPFEMIRVPIEEDWSVAYGGW